jgi:hypothetical protein
LRALLDGHLRDLGAGSLRSVMEPMAAVSMGVFDPNDGA